MNSNKYMSLPGFPDTAGEGRRWVGGLLSGVNVASFGLLGFLASLNQIMVYYLSFISYLCHRENRSNCILLSDTHQWSHFLLTVLVSFQFLFVIFYYFLPQKSSAEPWYPQFTFKFSSRNNMYAYMFPYRMYLFLDLNITWVALVTVVRRTFLREEIVSSCGYCPSCQALFPQWQQLPQTSGTPCLLVTLWKASPELYLDLSVKEDYETGSKAPYWSFQ